MNEELKRYERNQFRLKLELIAACLMPVMGFLWGIEMGLFNLIFLSPFWTIFIWIGIKNYSKAGDQIVLTRRYLTVDGFYRKELFWSEIKKFRLVDISPLQYRIPVLVIEFFDNAKYMKEMGEIDQKAHKLLYGDGIDVTKLNYFKEKPENIVSELNKQLKRRKNWRPSGR